MSFRQWLLLGAAAAIFGAVFLGERLEPLAYVGMALILAGSFVVNGMGAAPRAVFRARRVQPAVN